MRPVQTVTIDDHVDEDVQVLKLDVEGCELNAVRAVFFFAFSFAAFMIIC